MRQVHLIVFAAALTHGSPGMASDDLLRNVVISYDGAEAQGDRYTRAFFDVENRGSTKIKELTIHCEFQDSNGTFLDYSTSTVHGIEKRGHARATVFGVTKGRYGRVKCRPTDAK